MGRHKGYPTPWMLLCEAALAYANAEDENDLSQAEDRLRYAARLYSDGRPPRGKPDEVVR